MTNETNTPRPLTEAEKLARQNALAAETGKPAGDTKPAVAPVTVEHKANPTLPGGNGLPGKLPPTIGLVTSMAAPQGGASKPADAGRPVQTKAGKPEKAKGVDVSAAKAKKLGKAETALANTDFVCGYDLTKWPVALEKIKPTKAVIMAVRATGVLKTYVTKNELALAVYAGPHAREINVYDVATALQNVLGGSHDHKMNTVNQKAVPSGMWVRLPDTRVAGVNGGKPLIAYGVAPSPAGLKRIRAYFEANSLKLPKAWQAENPPSKPADKGNGNGGNHTAKA